MKKTGYEIIGMIKDGKAPKKIKSLASCEIYNWHEYYFEYTNELGTIVLLYNLNSQFEIIEDEPKVWKPKKGESYWVINSLGFVVEAIWRDDNDDELRYNLGNCFKTQEEAEKVVEKIKIYTQLKRYAEEHNAEKIDWENENQEKWAIDFDCEDLEVIPYMSIKEIADIYFTSEELCRRAIKEIGEENIKKLFEEE